MLQTKLITKLTPEQEARIPEYYDYWLGMGRSTQPVDKDLATQGIIEIYACLKKPKPLILFADSQLSAFWMEFILREIFKPESQLGSQLESQLRSQLRSQLGSQLESQLESQLRSQLRSQLGSQLRSQLRSQLWSQLESQLWSQLKSQLRSQLGSQLRSQLGSQLESQLRSQLGSQLSDQLGNYWWGQHQGSWVSFYGFIKEVLGVDGAPDFAGHKKMTLSSGWYLCYEGFAIVCDRPKTLNLDAQGRLHADGCKAVEYRDGWGVYAWHGTRLSEEIGSKKSADWKPEWLLKETNAEVRRVLLQGIGYERVMRQLGSELIHTAGDMELRKIQKSVDVEPITLLKVVCPSTQQIYALRVPPTMQTCEEARQWTFGDKPFEFILET